MFYYNFPFEIATGRKKSSINLKIMKSSQKQWTLNESSFGLGSLNLAYDISFPHRIWCSTTFISKLSRNSAIWRFWRFLVATLAIFCPGPRWIFWFLPIIQSTYLWVQDVRGLCLGTCPWVLESALLRCVSVSMSQKTELFSPITSNEIFWLENSK